MEIIKPPEQFRAGTESTLFREMLKTKLSYYPSKQFCLDLSDVDYMDTFTFRIVFDFLSKFTEVIPPKNERVIEIYDIWVDSKKGLKK